MAFPHQTGDLQIASEALNFSPEPGSRSLLLIYYINTNRRRKTELVLSAGLCYPIQPQRSEIHLSQIHLPLRRTL